MINKKFYQMISKKHVDKYNFTITIPKKTHEKFRDYCEREGFFMGRVVTFLLEEYLEQAEREGGE